MIGQEALSAAVMALAVSNACTLTLWYLTLVRVRRLEKR